MRVVLLTHVFPRAADDPLGAFLLHLTHALQPKAESFVVAPHAAGLREREMIQDIPIARFRYARPDQETLAYTGVMHEHVARGIGGKILFARFLFAYFGAALRAVRAHNADMIHAHWWLPGGFVGALVSQLTNVPLIITTHGTDVEQLRRARWARPLARFAFGRARLITCGSNYLRENLIELGVAHKNQVRVIPMPVNPLFVNDRRTILRSPSQGVPDEPQNRSNLQPSTQAQRINLLTVARLSQQKSIDTLIDAVEILRTRGVDTRLKIAGDGAQRASLEEMSRAKNLQTVIEFLGMCPQGALPDLYARCDVFVLPSVREGMGLVLAEALLCGAPVIAADSGGVTDIVINGETGLLFPERDANALADALQKFACDSQLKARLAENGRAYVLTRFTPERAAEQFLQAYADATH